MVIRHGAHFCRTAEENNKRFVVVAGAAVMLFMARWISRGIVTKPAQLSVAADFTVQYNNIGRGIKC